MDLEIILTGSFGVGKSSIYNRFIYNEFSNKYYGTLGVRVNEKEIDVNSTRIRFKIWDIAGEVSQTKVPKTYFHAPSIIIYVVDLNRDFGLKGVAKDLAYLKEITTGKKIFVVGNKKDLVEDQAIDNMLEEYPELNFFSLTSAKSGESVDELFRSIAFHCMDEVPSN